MNKLPRYIVLIVALSLIFLPLPDLEASAASCSPSAELSDGDYKRIAGVNRDATAAAVSRELYPGSLSADSLVLVRNDAFADGLAATGFAALKNGPILLTNPKTLSPEASAEIQRVLASNKTIYLVGGEQALSPQISQQLSDLGYQNQERIFGLTRYDTATALASRFATPTEVAITSGETFPDALSLGAAAARDKFPVLLTPKDQLHSATENYIRSQPGLQKIHVAGGSAAIANNTFSDIKDSAAPATQIFRYDGIDRYETNVKIAQAFFGPLGPCPISLVTGENFPDSLVAGVHAGDKNVPLLLTRGTKKPAAVVQNYLETNQSKIEGLYIYGGTQAISDLNAARAQAMTEPASFIFWGDSGESNIHWDKIAAAIVSHVQTEDIDGLFMLGDNIYEDGATSAADPKFASIYETPFAALLSNFVINVVLGNHDIRTNDGQGELDYAALNNYWNMPAPYYARTIDNNRLVFLNSTELFVDQAQLDFLDQELQADPLTLHRIVLAHHPVYSAGLHGTNNDQPWMQQLVNPLLIANSVDFFLAGHDHDFEALVPKDDVHYIVSGAATRLLPITPSADSLFAVSQYHFTKLNVFYSYADLAVYDKNNGVIWTHRYGLRQN